MGVLGSRRTIGAGRRGEMEGEARIESLGGTFANIHTRGLFLESGSAVG